MSKAENCRNLIKELLPNNQKLLSGDLIKEAKKRHVDIGEQAYINVHLRKARGRIRPYYRKGVNSTPPARARHIEVSKSRQVWAWIVENDYPIWSQAKPLINKAGFGRVGESLYNQQKSKARKSQREETRGSPGEVAGTINIGVIIECANYAKLLVQRLGEADAIRLVKTLS